MKINAKSIVGVLTFLYCVFPIFQYHLHTEFAKKFENYYFFFLSSSVFSFFEFVYTGSLVPYIFLCILWITLWWVLYALYRVFK